MAVGPLEKVLKTEQVNLQTVLQLTGFTLSMNASGDTIDVSLPIVQRNVADGTTYGNLPPTTYRFSQAEIQAILDPGNFNGMPPYANLRTGLIKLVQALVATRG